MRSVGNFGWLGRCPVFSRSLTMSAGFQERCPASENLCHYSPKFLFRSNGEKQPNEHSCTNKSAIIMQVTFVAAYSCNMCLQCFDAVGWVAGRAPACKKLEWWGAGVVICLEQGADLHMFQLMPLPLTVSCFSKIQIGFTFLVQAHTGSPGKRAVKWVCVCVYSCHIPQQTELMYSESWCHITKLRAAQIYMMYRALIGTIQAITYALTCSRNT